MTDLNDPGAIIASVRYWVETVVVDLNLCPFAGRELRQERIRFVATSATTEAELLASLQVELEWLDTHPAIETTLLTHPQVLQDFDDYNQFLEAADDLLSAMGVDGIYQLASFHPHYQFAETATADVENYTNRSPYPMPTPIAHPIHCCICCESRALSEASPVIPMRIRYRCVTSR